MQMLSPGSGQTRAACVSCLRCSTLRLRYVHLRMSPVIPHAHDMMIQLMQV